MSNDLENKIRQAIAEPKNLGAMDDADAIGTVGSPDCGDMLRMWVKFKEDDEGRKVIDKATFQTFGCETAIAVASVATELIAGKTIEEALSMSGAELSAPLGALPPMKIHCAQLVEGALRSALTPPAASHVQERAAEREGAGSVAAPSAPSPGAPSLIDSFASAPSADKKVKVVFKKPGETAPAGQ
ncbi:MAG TPA: iron-sulfur cluster assembly scaffold protein [Chthoniobacteraceae bacterium]|nr:iron-sulfur cluster assembly scaffold protein [Chthoniobacteraceae bacterium]